MTQPPPAPQPPRQATPRAATPPPPPGRPRAAAPPPPPLPPARPPRKLRPEALWARVERNRMKLAWFVVTFVFGSAVLLTLTMVLLPGVLLGLGATAIELVDPTRWFGTLAIVVVFAFAWLLVIGGIIAAVQLSNAEDWVRSRFSARELDPHEDSAIINAVQEMALAAGMPAPPRTLVLDVDSINAFALGTARSNALIGITRGMKEVLTPEEIRAVVAVLMARIIAGDIMFGTAMAALMGPIRAIRESRKAGANAASAISEGCAADGCVSGLDGCGDMSGCADEGCGCLTSMDSDSAGGCLGAIAAVVFVAVVLAITYAAVVTAAWIVTLWGRALHRTSYEKADSEGMLLLKDPRPMLSALSKCIGSWNAVPVGDTSYDGIFYVSIGGTPAVEKVEKRRYDRLREIVGTEGLAAPEL